MAVLKHPTAGTVVHVSDEQAKSLVAAGWVSAESPKPRQGRPKKSE